MEFESSHEAAERLHVNVRTVQKWAKDGKIPGAKRMGKTWMIPRGIKTLGVEDDHLLNVMPLLNSTFSPGRCIREIESLANAVEQDLAYGEYYYYSGQPGKAVKMVEPYLYHHDAGIALSASVIYVFASLSLGEIGQKVHGMDQKVMDVNQRMIAMTNTPELGDYAVTAAMFQNAIAVMMHLPLELKGELKQEVKYLPEGKKLFGAYILAHHLYLQHEYERALGVAETALLIIPGDYVIATIYLKLMIATILVELRRADEAKIVFMEAWKMAKPDGLIEPFADHYTLLHGLTEVCLKQSDAEGFQLIIQATQRYNKGWTMYHEKATQKVIADSLTPTEFTVAMLYSKSWSVKEIAAHLDVSERMVKHHMAMTYEKLGVSSREELKAYMPNR